MRVKGAENNSTAMPIFAPYSIDCVNLISSKTLFWGCFVYIHKPRNVFPFCYTISFYCFKSEITLAFENVFAYVKIGKYKFRPLKFKTSFL